MTEIEKKGLTKYEAVVALGEGAVIYHPENSNPGFQYTEHALVYSFLPDGFVAVYPKDHLIPAESKDKLQSVLEEVVLERKAQDEMWGEQNHSNTYWLAILTEEVGEVAERVCKAGANIGTENVPIQLEKMREELVQVAAVAVAWIEAFDRRKS